MRKYLFPIVAILGTVIGAFVVFWSEQEPPSPPIPFPPSTSPYEHAIYAMGIIEASTENIAVGTPFLLPITEIFVTEGDIVKKGDPLLKLDTRQLEAQKTIAEQELDLAIINADNLKKQFSFYERVKDKKAVSEQSYFAAYYAMKQAEQEVEVAKATLKQALVEIERATVCAPVEGEILQVNAHIGEIYMPASYNVTQSYNNLNTSLILMGEVAPLQMRIDIDEEDAWRFCKGFPATAFVRGNSHIHFPMEFVRVEPYILPKTSFTGETIERIDTRVLQVLYRFPKKDLPLYPGQLLDVYIEVPSPGSSTMMKKEMSSL